MCIHDILFEQGQAPNRTLSHRFSHHDTRRVRYGPLPHLSDTHSVATLLQSRVDPHFVPDDARTEDGSGAIECIHNLRPLYGRRTRGSHSGSTRRPARQQQPENDGSTHTRLNGGGWLMRSGWTPDGPGEELFHIIGRVVCMPLHIRLRVSERGLNDRFDARWIESAVNTRDVAEPEDGVSPNRCVSVPGKADADIFSPGGVPTVKGRRHHCVAKFVGVIAQERGLNLRARQLSYGLVAEPLCHSMSGEGAERLSVQRRWAAPRPASPRMTDPVCAATTVRRQAMQTTTGGLRAI